MKLGGVAEGTVVAEPSEAGEMRLVAHVVADAGRSLEVAGLRAARAQRLPDYMLPSTFVVLPALPRKANGSRD